MAWRRLGSVALQVVQASAAAAAQREEAEAAKPHARGAADGPVLFSRVAVISGPADHSPSVSAAA